MKTVALIIISLIVTSSFSQDIAFDRKNDRIRLGLDKLQHPSRSKSKRPVLSITNTDLDATLKKTNEKEASASKIVEIEEEIVLNSIEIDEEVSISNSENTEENNIKSTYTVQVAASKKELSQYFFGLTPVFSYKYDDGYYRYYSSKFDTIDKAKLYQLEITTTTKFKDAYIIKLRGMERELLH